MNSDPKSNQPAVPEKLAQSGQAIVAHGYELSERAQERITQAIRASNSSDGGSGEGRG